MGSSRAREHRPYCRTHGPDQTLPTNPTAPFLRFSKAWERGVTEIIFRAGAGRREGGGMGMLKVIVKYTY